MWRNVQRTLGLLLSVLLIESPAGVAAQDLVHTGRPLWRTFTTSDMGAFKTTRGAMTDRRGLVFGANEAGLVVYDGVTWRVFETAPGRRALRTLVPLDNEAWLVGGDATFGTFSPDPTGSLTWTNLLPDAPQAQPSFESIYKIIEGPSGHLLLTDRSVLKWADGQLAEHLSQPPTGFTFTVGEDIYINFDDRLVAVTDKTPEVTTPAIWPDLDPVNVLDSLDSQLILVTRRSGLFAMTLSDGSLSLSPLWDTLPASLDTASVSAAAVQRNGSYVLGTENGDLIHIERDGSVPLVLNKQSGFRAGRIRSIVVGQDESLFVLHDRGTTWVQSLNGPRLWDATNGLIAPVTSVAIDGGIIFAGTNDGLFRTVTGHRMVNVAEVGPDPIHTLNTFRRSTIRGHTSLLIGRKDGLYDFFGGRLDLITSRTPIAVHVSIQQPSRIAIAVAAGVLLMDFIDGAWQEAGLLPAGQNRPPQDLTESIDDRLFAVLDDGTVTVFAADQWLANPIDIDGVPFRSQTISRRPSSNLTPFFSDQGSEVNLFLNGAPLLWDMRTERFAADVKLSTEMREVNSWPLAAAWSPGVMWLQSSSGAFAYQTNEAGSPLIELPSIGSGTLEHSLITSDIANDRMLFSTPRGLIEFPIATLGSEQSKQDLPKLNIRHVRVGTTVQYEGHGVVPGIELPPQNTVIELAVSAFAWNLDCSDLSLVLTRMTGGPASRTIRLDHECRGTVISSDTGLPTGTVSAVLARDGEALTKPVSLEIHLVRPWFTRSWIPALLGMAFAAIVVIARRRTKLGLPETGVHLLSMAACLLVLWAAGLALGLVVAGGSLGSVALQLGGVTVSGLCLPFMVKGLKRLQNRRMPADA